MDKCDFELVKKIYETDDDREYWEKECREYIEETEGNKKSA